MSLPSVYTDFSAAELAAEKERIIAATEIERSWMADARVTLYETQDDVLKDANAGVLVAVQKGVGYAAIERLSRWSPRRDSADHPFYYSPNFILPGALDIVTTAIDETHANPDIRLAVTSLVRHKTYQSAISGIHGKMTVPVDSGPSSHQAALAIDIDGCGGWLRDKNGFWVKVNPREPDYEEHQQILRDRFGKLESKFDELHGLGVINFVPENRGTQEECFHICVNPFYAGVTS